MGEAFEVWAMDEHRVGLKPIVRKVWALRGQRPTLLIHPRYEWLYVYAFVQPTTGRSFYLTMPTVNKEAFLIALRHFAEHALVDKHKTVILLVDNAGWHVKLTDPLPSGLHLRYLPPYSPELQPAEHLWQLTDVPLVNRCFASLDDLETVLVERCRWLMAHPELIRSALSFLGGLTLIHRLFIRIWY